MKTKYSPNPNQKVGIKMVGIKLNGNKQDNMFKRVYAKPENRLIFIKEESKEKPIHISLSNLRIYAYDEEAYSAVHNMMRRNRYACIRQEPNIFGESSLYLNIPDNYADVVIREMELRFGEDAVSYCDMR